MKVSETSGGEKAKVHVTAAVPLPSSPVKGEEAEKEEKEKEREERGAGKKEEMEEEEVRRVDD